MRRLYVWLVVAIVVLGAIAATAAAYVFTRPCTPPGPEASAGGHYCAAPGLPSPTTLIAAGTVFTIAAGQYDYFQFHPTPATAASVTGSFATTHITTVYIMTPGVFADFSASTATFQCPSTGLECFTTGDLSVGSVNVSFLPVYYADDGNASVTQPWFLVMQNGDVTAATNVTWVTSLIENYVDITASTALALHAPVAMRTLA